MQLRRILSFGVAGLVALGLDASAYQLTGGSWPTFQVFMSASATSRRDGCPSALITAARFSEAFLKEGT